MCVRVYIMHILHMHIAYARVRQQRGGGGWQERLCVCVYIGSNSGSRFRKPPSLMVLHHVNFAGLIGNYCSETMGYTFIPLRSRRRRRPVVINGRMF